MNSKSLTYGFIAFAGDLGVMYASLWLALTIRHQTTPHITIWEQHTAPFTIIFLLWALVFYIGDLYNPRQMHKNFSIFQSIVRHQSINGAISILFFYIFPVFSITPKTNLFITLGIATICIYSWRLILKSITRQRWMMERLAFIGTDEESKELTIMLQENFQFGYIIIPVQNTQDIEILMKNKSLDGLVVSLANKEQNAQLFRHIFNGIKFYNLPSFYERITGKIPLSIVEQAWFLENVSTQVKRPYDILKRLIDIMLSCVGLIVCLIFIPLISLTLLLVDRGPVFYSQKRIGQNNKIITLTKFRTMKVDAEKDGIKFANENDPRVTPIGRFLRKTRLDELPQLWSVLKGDLSFVGPRPERPEWVAQFDKQIPYYSVRHLVKPGLTGWAQINYEYAASLKETYKKLQYDIYYIKNRSFLLDLGITLKTIKTVLAKAGR